MHVLGCLRQLVIVGTALAALGACTSDRPAAPDEPTTEAAATTCDGAMGAERVAGDLVVPRNATCRLAGTAVDGRTSVEDGATLVGTSAYFGEGISAHSFRRIELREGRVEGRDRTWADEYAWPESEGRQRDYVFDGGRTLVVRGGDPHGSYHVHDMGRRVEIVGINLDLGSIFCAGNEQRPVVRRISAETPGKLQGQCAGRRGFGDTDF